MANGGNCSTDVVGGCEARARADYVRVYGDVGQAGVGDQLELAVIWLESDQNDAGRFMALADLNVVIRLPGHSLSELGEQEQVEITRVGARADAEEHVVVEGM